MSIAEETKGKKCIRSRIRRGRETRRENEKKKKRMRGEKGDLHLFFVFYGAFSC
jgi:hypothetical protein